MEGGAGNVSTVIASAGDVLTMAGTIVDTITGNSVLCFMLGASFVGIGIAVFRKLKGVCQFVETD